MNPFKSAFYLLFSLVPALLLIYPYSLSDGADPNLLLIGLIWAGSVVGLVLYIIHLWSNQQVQRGNRELWLLSMLLAFMPVSVIYWFYYLRPQS